MFHKYTRSEIKISLNNYARLLSKMMETIKKVVTNLPFETKKVSLFRSEQTFSQYQLDLMREYAFIEDVKNNIDETSTLISESMNDDDDFFPITEAELKIVREFMETNNFSIESRIFECEKMSEEFLKN